MSQIEQYYHDIRHLKSCFIKSCLVTKKYEAYKVWAHWLIRNLCENTHNYHVIPNRDAIEHDKEIIHHLIDKGCPVTQVDHFYKQIVSKVCQLYDQYHLLKVQQIKDHDHIKAMSQLITYAYVDNEYSHVYQFKNVY